VLDKAIEDVKREKNWLVREFYYIEHLESAAKLAQAEDERHRDLGIKEMRAFERKAARAESKIYNFDERIINILNFLRHRFPSWNQALTEIETELKVYVGNILKRVSFIDGTIPQLLKQNKIDEILTEIENLKKDGIRPLTVVLKHLEDQLSGHKNKETPIENEREQQVETALDKQPFMIVFHGTNTMKEIYKILSVRHLLPTTYLGRRLEYVMEIDYFWIEHRGKISAFFGHTPYLRQPRKAKKILKMRHTEINPESATQSQGILNIDWIFARAGQVKLMIEIKQGVGKKGHDERALDYLIAKIREYGLENRIMFLAFAIWPLEYLKKKLPNSTTIVIISKLWGVRMSFPNQRTFRNIMRFHLFNSLKSFKDCDMFAKWARGSEKAIKNQVMDTIKDGKPLIGGKIIKKEVLYWLMKHGGRGALIWKSPETIISWLRTEPNID
jgi:hypothetical protein